MSTNKANVTTADRKDKAKKDPLEKVGAINLAIAAARQKQIEAAKREQHLVSAHVPVAGGEITLSRSPSPTFGSVPKEPGHIRVGESHSAAPTVC